MIKVLAGKKGNGKTKTLISDANEKIKVANGSVVFVSSDIKPHMYEVDQSIRMVDTSEFDISNYKEFYGFLCGLVSNNFDISDIYIDNLFKIVGPDVAGLDNFFHHLNKLVKAFNINFEVTLSIDVAELSDEVKAYI